MRVFTWKRSAYLAAAAAAAAAAFYIFRPSPALVESSRVARGPLSVAVEEDGETRIRDRYVITTPVDGRVRRVLMEEGDSVRAGAVIVLIDPAVLDARGREQANAHLRELHDARTEAALRVTQARTELEQAMRDRDRTDALVAEGALARRDSEVAAMTVRVRTAEVDAARLRVQELEHEVEGARAALLEAGRQGATPVAVRAPISGRVLRIVSRDERVAAAGTPIVELGDPAAMDVTTQLLSSDAVQVHPGAPATIEGWGGPDALAASVSRVEASAFTKVSALGVEEQRVEVIAWIEHPPPALGDRYRVRVRIVTWEAPDVLKVAVSALARDGAGWYVYVVRDGRARRQSVSLGHRNEHEAEVRAGLTQGDVVVQYPSDRIADGVRVRTG